MYKRILVATDGSKLSNLAVEHAIGLADITGAEVVALVPAPELVAVMERWIAPEKLVGGVRVRPAS